MIVKNEEGRKIEIKVYGDTEDVEIDEAYYLDGNDDVTEEDIEFIMYMYAAEIEEELSQQSFDFMRD